VAKVYVVASVYMLAPQFPFFHLVTNKGLLVNVLIFEDHIWPLHRKEISHPL